jgi:hypothetical protein
MNSDEKDIKTLWDNALPFAKVLAMETLKKDEALMDFDKCSIAFRYLREITTDSVDLDQLREKIHSMLFVLNREIMRVGVVN